MFVLQEIPGLTDKVIPRRLGPKRASKIRKLFNLSKEDDVRQYVVKRPLPQKEGKKERFKAPKIQRLITPTVLQVSTFLTSKNHTMAVSLLDPVLECSQLWENKFARLASVVFLQQLQTKRASTSTCFYVLFVILLCFVLTHNGGQLQTKYASAPTFCFVCFSSTTWRAPSEAN